MWPRPVLYWTPAEAFAPPLALDETGWLVHATADPAVVRARVDQGAFRVGLVAFNPVDGAHSLVQDIALANPRMEWIALIPPRGLTNGSVRRMVADTFLDFHTAPVQPERLALALGHAYGIAELRESAAADGASGIGEFSMVGRSPQMQRLYRAIRRVAATEASVLITGETGTGKELAARAIHQLSACRRGPFGAVNSGALPETLIQAELFGHEKGAFTDARTRKIGRIEMAAGGTLFLDEIGDLPLSVQGTLLRFLQERTIERLGGRGPISVNVRVLAATHVDLEKLVREERFRQDLYYRLNVLRLDVPPLREREGDVELLASVLFERFVTKAHVRVRGFSRAALSRMTSYDWPGNVRELINCLHRAMVMCEKRLISPSDLGLERRAAPRCLHRLEDSRGVAEKCAIREALIRCRTVTSAATELGVSRMTLYRLMSKYELHAQHPNSLDVAATAS